MVRFSLALRNNSEMVRFFFLLALIIISKIMCFFCLHSFFRAARIFGVFRCLEGPKNLQLTALRLPHLPSPLLHTLSSLI
uniref:Putative secreted protein n=1 Tax=Rhipicephalus microplus TaxID=6941 RepID=A0A6M2DAY8_RHIMP